MIKTHAEKLAQAVAEQDPRSMAQCTKEVIETARQLTASEQWAEIAELSQSVDEVLANARHTGRLTTQEMTLLADLAQQAFSVLDFLSQAKGERQTGQFRAALGHANRLDRMTENQLNLVALVELVKDTETKGNDLTSFTLR